MLSRRIADYEALEPHIDAATMRVHHLKHHQKYTDVLNGALSKLRADQKQKHLAKMGIDALLQHLLLKSCSVGGESFGQSYFCAFGRRVDYTNLVRCCCRCMC